MRASRMVKGISLHISGAEGIYGEELLPKKIMDYYLRAIHHPRGKPDSIVFQAELIREQPIATSLLPVTTFNCSSPIEARKVAKELLLKTGVSEIAIKTAFRIVNSKITMRGAALVKADTGERLEPDSKRGVRASRLGIDRLAEKRLSRKLQRQGINTTTVKEALVLASKVASCDGIIAELCVSDDPHYTTGYVASIGLGYVRITNIKRPGSMSGGRVFFVNRDEISEIINYLEKRPVIATI